MVERKEQTTGVLYLAPTSYTENEEGIANSEENWSKFPFGDNITLFESGEGFDSFEEIRPIE